MNELEVLNKDDEYFDYYLEEYSEENCRTNEYPITNEHLVIEYSEIKKEDDFLERSYKKIRKIYDNGKKKYEKIKESILKALKIINTFKYFLLFFSLFLLNELTINPLYKFIITLSFIISNCCFLYIIENLYKKGKK